MVNKTNLSDLDIFTQRTYFMSALNAGEQAIREGLTKYYTPELLARIEQDARQHAAESRSPDPEGFVDEE